MDVDYSPMSLGDRTVGNFTADRGFSAGEFANTGDASADPFGGQTAPNGKEIYTPDDAADNLTRDGADWTYGNNGALDDGVLTFGFWNSLEEVQNSYYTEISPDGFVLTADSIQIFLGHFAPFNEQQRSMAIANLQLWDDLINVTIQPASSAAEADITFGFVQMSPAAGAHAYYPQEEALNSFGFVEAGRVSGDVWGNYLYSGAVSGRPNIFADTSIGGYAWQAITHELGHSFGLAHGGEYNASDDNDGDGVPDPITYENDAYFFQDSQQYTIMSYFDGSVTGQAAVRWNGANSVFVYAQTPQVHDILAVQNVYGADYATRSGDTVYGFNSNADRGVFDFATNTAPIVTIWDGGGSDTLDLSGFNANNIIDINEGAFSSAGFKIDQATKAYFGAAFGLTTEADFAAFFAANGVGPDGRPVDNIAIAYNAEIENAIGGSGNDQLIGNDLDNILKGNGGNDVLLGGNGSDRIYGGDGLDVVKLGAGDDMFVAEIGATKSVLKTGKMSVDILTDFDANGNDTIDLSGLGSFHFDGTSANKDAWDLTYKVYESVNGAERALGIDIDGQSGASNVLGPVTVVYGNLDGGNPDLAIILLNTNGVDPGDFLLG
ncbi:MAG TPA: M10 family metallopeptidase C-terminal domain-containing protein [Sphingomicrobium sp.]|nr:M10 family metallopeptidase C-terminal domain-containing protein [Sphingomicrobium sp.]